MHTDLDVPPTTVPEWTYVARFECERPSAARARAFVSCHLIEHRLLRLVDPVRAAVSELAANAIVHARTPFSVTLSATELLVELRVQDDAGHARVRPPVQRAVPVLSEGGRGLNILATLSHDWGITTGSNTKSVWATFTTSPDPDRGRH